MRTRRILKMRSRLRNQSSSSLKTKKHLSFGCLNWSERGGRLSLGGFQAERPMRSNNTGRIDREQLDQNDVLAFHKFLCLLLIKADRLCEKARILNSISKTSFCMYNLLHVTRCVV